MEAQTLPMKHIFSRALTSTSYQTSDIGVHRYNSWQSGPWPGHWSSLKSRTLHYSNTLRLANSALRNEISIQQLTVRSLNWPLIKSQKPNITLQQLQASNSALRSEIIFGNTALRSIKVERKKFHAIRKGEARPIPLRVPLLFDTILMDVISCFLK